jgi:hypothetical protein
MSYLSCEVYLLSHQTYTVATLLGNLTLHSRSGMVAATRLVKDLLNDIGLLLLLFSCFMSFGLMIYS